MNLTIEQDRKRVIFSFQESLWVTKCKGIVGQSRGRDTLPNLDSDRHPIADHAIIVTTELQRILGILSPARSSPPPPRREGYDEKD